MQPRRPSVRLLSLAVGLRSGRARGQHLKALEPMASATTPTLGRLLRARWGDRGRRAAHLQVPGVAR
eukprot:14059303-Alexandrium_andersonii.AAC.1